MMRGMSGVFLVSLGWCARVCGRTAKAEAV
jgi:hypothetical protein